LLFFISLPNSILPSARLKKTPRQQVGPRAKIKIDRARLSLFFFFCSLFASRDNRRRETIDAKRARGGKRTHTHTRHNAKFSLKTRISFLFFLFSHPFFLLLLSFFCPLDFTRRRRKKKEIKKYTRERKIEKIFSLSSPNAIIIIDHNLIADNALLFERVGASFGGGLRDDVDGERERDDDSNGTRIAHVPDEKFEHHVVFDLKTSAVRARVRMAGDWMRVQRRERVQDFVRVVLRFGFSRRATSRWFAA